MKPLRHKTSFWRITFVDPCCRAGYDLPDLETGGLGGTEATVLRVAAAIASKFEVTIYQHGRAFLHLSKAGYLRSMEELRVASGHDAIVVINRWKVAMKLRRQHPDTPIFLWLHVYPGRHNRKMGVALKSAEITVICVSDTHARELEAFLGAGTPSLTVLYNPVGDDLHADDTLRDPNRLLFASSPHKGLAEVFDQFSTLRQNLPDLNLMVADPGYLSWETGPVPDGVTFLGSLSHAALIREMRRALCLFYPQTSFAETFGLVLAEANAVGTPVLVHAGLGANSEIVGDPVQRVNGCDPAQILARIRAWRHAAPRAEANPDFRLNRVARQWVQLLQRAAAGQRKLSVV